MGERVRALWSRGAAIPGERRGVCLNQSLFTDVADVRANTAAGRNDFSAVQPHSALGNLMPALVAKMP